MKVTYSCL